MEANQWSKSKKYEISSIYIENNMEVNQLEWKNRIK